jgi:hypothetical protein
VAQPRLVIRSQRRRSHVPSQDPSGARSPSPSTDRNGRGSGLPPSTVTTSAFRARSHEDTTPQIRRVAAARDLDQPAALVGGGAALSFGDTALVVVRGAGMVVSGADDPTVLTATTLTVATTQCADGLTASGRDRPGRRASDERAAGDAGHQSSQDPPPGRVVGKRLRCCVKPTSIHEHALPSGPLSSSSDGGARSFRGLRPAVVDGHESMPPGGRPTSERCPAFLLGGS